MSQEHIHADIGDEVPPFDWTPQNTWVKDMMALSGWLSNTETERGSMSGPNRFTDEDAARSEGFNSLIVPGNLGMTAMEAALRNWLPNGRIDKLDCVFRMPVSQGETYSATGVVTDRHDQPDRVILEIDVYLLGRDGQRPQGGMAVVTIETAETN